MTQTAAPRVVHPESVTAHNVLGSPTLVHLPGEATAGAFSLCELRGGPGVGVPTHVHEREEETFHVLEGRVRFEVGPDVHEVGPGTTVYGPRGVPHAWWVVEGPARIMLVLSPAGMEPMFAELAHLSAAGHPDFAEVAAVCAKFGVTFPPTPAP